MPDPSSVGLAGLFHHLDLTVAQYHVDTRGPYGSGDHVLTNDSDGVDIKFTSGIAFVCRTIPAHWGHKLAFNGIVGGLDWSDDIYSPPWGYASFFASNPFTTMFLYDRALLTHINELVLWGESIASAVGLHVEPGWTVDFYTIRV